MRELIIMQGISGSGKSFVADALKYYYMHLGKSCEICSTDDYWYLEDPTTYNFDSTKIATAHNWNKSMAETAMIYNREVIIISNTNTTQKEAQPYIDLANKYNYTVRTVSVNCSIETAKKANSERPTDRQVPESVIDAQSQRITPIKIT